MDFLLLGLQQLADPAVFLTMCIGAILGVVVGAIPGAGAAVTISILLPTTFSMDPLNGMTLLLGVYCGAAYGSAIPAVMINTPGSPVAVLTALEAKPFVDRGEARRAMSLAYSSSFRRWRAGGAGADGADPTAGQCRHGTSAAPSLPWSPSPRWCW
jgi:putative tricarboxylic transport membrane protein